jgi:hypothetical protein
MSTSASFTWTVETLEKYGHLLPRKHTDDIIASFDETDRLAFGHLDCSHWPAPDYSQKPEPQTNLGSLHHVRLSVADRLA